MMANFGWQDLVDCVVLAAIIWTFLASICCLASLTWKRAPKRDPVLDQELNKRKAENALLEYERGEMLDKLESMQIQAGQLKSENHILRQRVTALEGLNAVKDAELERVKGNDEVIKKCDEALGKLRGVD